MTQQTIWKRFFMFLKRLFYYSLHAFKCFLCYCNPFCFIKRNGQYSQQQISMNRSINGVRRNIVKLPESENDNADN